MRQLMAVMRIQWKLFLKDKGILMFYILGILGIGGIFPIFFKNITPQLTLVMFMCVTMQKQWTAESVAGERESETLESAMSSPLYTRTFLLGKVWFNFLCALIYASTIWICLLIVRRLTNVPQELSPIGWMITIAGALSVLLVTASYGVWCSAKEETVRAAGRSPAFVCYLFSVLFIILLTTLTMKDTMPTEAIVFISVVFFLAVGGMMSYTFFRILRMDRSAIIEVEHHTSIAKTRKPIHLSHQPRSRLISVFFHELRYLKTLKMLLFNFALLSLCPAGLQLAIWLKTNTNDLNYAVLIALLIVPRIPTNLIAYSVGGEKAYRTGESILSTPVSVSDLFWGKAMVPCLISVVMLVLSTILNLLTANLFALLDKTPFLFYNVGQLVLLIGVGMVSCFVMILASAIFSLKAKTPRKGLYYSTFLGFVFFLPAAAILYLADGNVLWALGYFVLLLAVCIYLYSKVRRITRAELMTNL